MIKNEPLTYADVKKLRPGTIIYEVVFGHIRPIKCRNHKGELNWSWYLFKTKKAAYTYCLADLKSTRADLKESLTSMRKLQATNDTSIRYIERKIKQLDE